MRRVLWLALLIGSLLAGGCVPATLTPPPTLAPAPAQVLPTAIATAAALLPSAPTAGPSTIAPTAAAAATTAPTVPVVAAATPAAPVTAATRPAVPTAQTGLQAPAATSTAGGATFTSTRLGISFDYLTSADGQTFAVQEQGDKVYVYAGGTPPTQGQYVQVYQKPAGQKLSDAIKAQVLQGYSLTDCIVTDVANPETGQQWPATYTFAQIQVPRGPNDDMGTLSVKAQKCPQPYAAVGGLAYFVADSQHPDRFAFLSIGQYYIPGPGNRPWHNTLRFLGPTTGSTGPTPEARAAGPYVDDRSTPQAVMISYVNALNNFQYARAYSYWNAAVGQQSGLPPFQQFSSGFADTKSVQLYLGAVTTDAGAGQIYYWTPIAFVAATNGGQMQTFVGCYRMHLARPGFQGQPPFMPLAIESASVQQVANDANIGSLLGTACSPAGQPMAPTPAPDPNDISPARYIDDRSDGVQVLRSLFNAINSREYVRAYSYWEENSLQRPPYTQFEQGYANTKSVLLIAGASAPDGAAGSLYYRVPVVLIATNNDNSVQTFAGCYTLHMANPAMQEMPPFRSLGIQSAVVRQVPNNSAPQPLLQSACAQ